MTSNILVITLQFYGGSGTKTLSSAEPPEISTAVVMQYNTAKLMKELLLSY